MIHLHDKSRLSKLLLSCKMNGKSRLSKLKWDCSVANPWQHLILTMRIFKRLFNNHSHKHLFTKRQKYKIIT